MGDKSGDNAEFPRVPALHPGYAGCVNDVCKLSNIPVSSAIADRDPPLVACATVKCARQGLEDEGHAGEA